MNRTIVLYIILFSFSFVFDLCLFFSRLHRPRLLLLLLLLLLKKNNHYDDDDNDDDDDDYYYYYYGFYYCRCHKHHTVKNNLFIGNVLRYHFSM